MVGGTGKAKESDHEGQPLDPRQTIAKICGGNSRENISMLRMLNTVISASIMCLMCVGCNINTPSKGAKLGRIVRLSEEGVIFKTWQGELVRGGLTDGSGSLGGSFTFTIADTRLLEQAYDAFMSQEEVIINYENSLLCPIWNSELMVPNFVTNVYLTKLGK